MRVGEYGFQTEASFIDHVGVGAITGDPWLSLSSKRVKLDVLLCVFTRTFTWSFDIFQEYALLQQVLEYRDWLESVVGHHLRLDLHLVLYEHLVSREEISELQTNQFWFSAHDTWRLLQPYGIIPSTYDVVWCAWAWENGKDAFPRYGGGTALGPESTPFMSFPVSRFWPGETGPYLILEHEAQHTYELLWSERGFPIVKDPAQDLQAGWPHADYTPQLLEAIIKEEPGLFEPVIKDEAVVEYMGLKALPGRMQSAVHAWILRRWPQKNWLQLTPTFGTVVAPRSSFQEEPLFSSVTIITSPQKEKRTLFLPVRLRDHGRHLPGLEVEGVLEGDRVLLHECVYKKHQQHRLPPQTRWSLGWDGQSYYATWVTVPLGGKQNLLFSIYAHQVPLFKPITIPVRVITEKQQEAHLSGVFRKGRDKGVMHSG